MSVSKLIFIFWGNISFKSHQSRMFIELTTVWICNFLCQLKLGCGFLCKELSHTMF